MFRTVRQLKEDYALQAKDGEIGRVTDVYFETLHWALRYFVVKTGKWLEHRSVLLSPESICTPAGEQNRLPVNLTKEQIRQSPGMETYEPVSRQYENALRKHYGWPSCWSGMYGEVGFPSSTTPPVPDRPVDGVVLEGDPRLFSANAVVGHHVMATDGEIGQVDDFLIDDLRWTVRYLVVSTRKGWPGKKVILSPWWTSELVWPERRIHLDLKRDTIRNSPPYDPDKTLTYEASGKLHDYYDRPHHPDEGRGDAVMRSDNPNQP